MGPQDTDDNDRFQKVRTDFYKKLGVASGSRLSPKDSKALTKLAKASAAASDKADQAAHDKARKVAKDKVLYEDRRARAEATISALRDYSPASDTLISHFIDSLLEADRILKADGQAFEAANKALHAESIKKALSKADEAWGKAEEGARKNKTTAPAYAQVDALRDSLGAARALLSDAAAEAFSQKVLDAERGLLSPSLQPKALSAVTSALDTLANDLETMKSDAESARTAAQTARLLAKTELDKIDAPDPAGGLVTEADRAVLQRMLTDADTALGSREFVLARTQFADLASRALTLATAGTRDRSAWAKRAAELVRLTKEVGELAGSATSPAVQESATALSEQLEELAKQKPGIDIAFPAALAKLDGAQVALNEMLKEELNFLKFGSERAAAAERIRALDEAAEVAFQPLRAAVLAVTHGKENDLADRPFKDRLQKLRKEWSARLAVAQDVDTLDEAAAATELRSIATDLAAAARDGALLGRLIDNEALQVAQAAYAQARDAVQPQLEKLTNIDALAGAKTLAALDAVAARLDSKATPGAYTAAATEVAQLGREALKAAQTKLGLVSGLQLRLQQLLAPLPDELDKMFAAIQKMTNAAKQKPHAAMHATLVTAVEGLRAMGKLSQVPLLNEAIDDAEKLAKDVAMSVAAVTKGEAPGGGEVLSFEEARRRLVKLKAKLDATEVQTYAKVSAFDAGEAHKALEKGLGSTTLSALEEALDALTTTVAKIEREAAAAKADYDKFSKDEVAPVQARIEAAPFKDAKSYAAAMKGRLKAVLGDAQFEGGLANARTALQTIKNELDDVAASAPDETGAPRALAGKEKAAAAAERAKEIEKAKYEGEVKVLEKQIEGAKGLYPDDHEGLRQALRDAKKSADKGASYEDARDQLRTIRTRLALLEQNPHGIGIHVRKQLPAVNRRYKAAVSAYWAGLDAVGQAVTALPTTDLPSAAKAAVRTGLGAVRVLYNPAVFDRSVAQVSNEGTPAPARSAARETALRDVRRLGAYLTDDFRLQELADTPFHGPMRGLLSELRLALLDLENNLLVSM